MLVHEFSQTNSNLIFTSVVSKERSNFRVLAATVSQISLRINSYNTGFFQNY